MSDIKNSIQEQGDDNSNSSYNLALENLSPTSRNTLEDTIRGLSLESSKNKYCVKRSPCDDVTVIVPKLYTERKGTSHNLEAPTTNGQIRELINLLVNYVFIHNIFRPPGGIIFSRAELSIGGSKSRYFYDDGGYNKPGWYTVEKEIKENVYLIRDNKSGRKLIKKIIPKRTFKDEVTAWKEQDFLYEELSNEDRSKTAGSPKLVLMKFFISEDIDNVQLFAEYLDHSFTLTEVIHKWIDYQNQDKDRSKTSEKHRAWFPLFVLQQLVNYIRQFHERGFAHRDMHGENILLQVVVSQHPKTLSFFRIFVLDYGSATSFIHGIQGVASVEPKSTPVSSNDTNSSSETIQGVLNGRLKDITYVVKYYLQFALCKKVAPDAESWGRLLQTLNDEDIKETKVCRELLESLVPLVGNGDVDCETLSNIVDKLCNFVSKSRDFSESWQHDLTLDLFTDVLPLDSDYKNLSLAPDSK